MTTSHLASAEPVLVAARAPAVGLRKAALGAIFLTHLAVDMQTSSLAVLLPPLLATFHLTYASAAVIISANNLVIAIAQPLFGIFGDYRHARWLLPAGCALCGLAMASVLFMPSYPLILVAVILSGLGSAAFHPEALASTRAVSGDKIATGSSVFFFAGNLGFALGPLVAALLLEQWGTPGMLGMLTPVAAGLMVVGWQTRALAASPLPAGEAPPRGFTRPRRATLFTLAFLLVFIALRLAVSGGLQTFIPLYFSGVQLNAPTMSKAAIAQLLSVFSISGTIGTLFSGPLAERMGRRLVIALSMGVSLVALYFFLRVDGWAQLVVCGVAGAALSMPWTLTVLMMQEALPNNVGLASGLSLGTAYGAMGLVVALLGWLADHVGLAVTMQLITWLPLVVLGMGLFVPERKTK